jgi:hypothetical protein
MTVLAIGDARCSLVMMQTLLGVYCSDAAAQARIESAWTLPGFSDEPDCFQITLCTLGKDEWTEGFSIAE